MEAFCLRASLITARTLQHFPHQQNQDELGSPSAGSLSAECQCSVFQAVRGIAHDRETTTYERSGRTLRSRYKRKNWLLASPPRKRLCVGTLAVNSKSDPAIFSLVRYSPRAAALTESSYWIRRQTP